MRSEALARVTGAGLGIVGGFILCVALVQSSGIH